MKELHSFLDKYKKAKYVNYAVLVTGKWGHGKTYALKEYTKRKTTWNYISLFGKSNVNQIKEELFYLTHPTLGNKKLRFFSSVAAKMIRINVDTNNDDKSDATVGGSNIGSIASVFVNLKGKHIILDDLERTKINMDLLKGFIAELLEEGSKVVMVGNVDEEEVKEKVKIELPKEDKKKQYDSHAIDDFLKNKEKIIGADFHFEASADSLDDVLHASKYFKDEARQLEIKAFFNEVVFKNLRLWRRAIVRTEDVLDEIERLYTEAQINEKMIHENSFRLAVLKDVVVFYFLFQNEQVTELKLEKNSASDERHSFLTRNFSYLRHQGDAINFNFINKVCSFNAVQFSDVLLAKSSFYQKYKRDENPIFKIAFPYEYTSKDWLSIVNAILDKVNINEVSLLDLFYLTKYVCRQEKDLQEFFSIELLRSSFNNLCLKEVSYNWEIASHMEDYMRKIDKYDKNQYFSLLSEIWELNEKVQNQEFLKEIRNQVKNLENNGYILQKYDWHQSLYMISDEIFPEVYAVLSPERQLYLSNEIQVANFKELKNIPVTTKQKLEANRRVFIELLKKSKYPTIRRIEKLVAHYDNYLKCLDIKKGFSNEKPF